MSKDDMPLYLSSLFEIAADLPMNHPDRQRQMEHFINLELEVLTDLGLGGTRLSSSVMSRGNLTQAKFAKLTKIKNDRKFKEFLFQLIIKDALDRIDALIEYYTAEMERLVEEMAEINTTLDDLQNDHEAIEQVIVRYREDGLMEIDTPAELAILAYETRTNATGTLKDDELYSKLFDVQLNIENEQEYLSKTLSEKQEEYAFNKDCIEDLKDLKETLKNGTPQQQVTALQTLDQFEENKSFVQGQKPTQLSNLDKLAVLKEETKVITELSDNNNDPSGFSFDFPPLAEEFSQASDGNNENISSASDQPQKDIIPSVIIATPQF